MVDVVVAGAGPLGASTACHLAERGVQVAIADDGDARAAYRNSGGAICWHRPDPRHAAMIRETAEFIRSAVADGAPIRCREVPYVFLHEGVQAPALNVASTDLVAHLVDRATRAGAVRADVGRVTAVDRAAGRCTVHGARGSVEAHVVVLALGTGNAALLSDLEAGWEKRQLFVLDLPVGPERIHWPHTIAPIGDGFAYVFVKELDRGLRVLVGQEDLLADDDPTGPVDHFAALLAAGVADRFPFLTDATVEQVLWGLDWPGKLPHVTTDGAGLVSVNCGSAVRVCIPAGRAAADAATRALDRVR